MIDLSDDEPLLDGDGVLKSSSETMKSENAKRPLERQIEADGMLERPAKRQCEVSQVEVVNFTHTVRAPGTAIFSEPNQDFLVHLEQNGYAVLQGVLGNAVQCFRDEFWRAMTSVVPDLDYRNEQTWNFPKGFRGIVTSYGLPHADFAWMIRAHPRLRHAFASIFGTNDLVVSLDAVIAQAQNSKSKLPEPGYIRTSIPTTKVCRFKLSIHTLAVDHMMLGPVWSLVHTKSPFHGSGEQKGTT